MELLTRKEVPVEETWDLSLIFPEEKDMWDALEKAKEDVKKFCETYAGKLNTAENRQRMQELRQQAGTGGLSR